MVARTTSGWASNSASRSDAVHAWDMPGYGRSSKDPAHPVDFGTRAEAFAAVLDHWGLDQKGSDQPHVVAHDVGAVSLRSTAECATRR